MNHAMATRSFLLVVSFLSLFGQTVSTEIFGLVSDSSGAVIPSATIRVTRVATGDVREARTNDSGNYIFPLLDIGEYEVTCGAQGFKTEVARNKRYSFNRSSGWIFIWRWEHAPRWWR